ncbi:hypothetical protein [Halomarina rubra]|uniref:Small CPxCG-related zinc finger protein n=1 Tax=Halomarina rubra TaxID=2071873 RepID=A0ABD6AUW1_9EURY|nr:hypothetical protein [Halomarina rubra]
MTAHSRAVRPDGPVCACCGLAGAADELDPVNEQTDSGVGQLLVCVPCRRALHAAVCSVCGRPATTGRRVDDAPVCYRCHTDLLLGNGRAGYRLRSDRGGRS